MMMRGIVGDSILLLVTLCWGISFPLVENAVKATDPFSFVVVRFFLAALFLLPFVVRELRSTSRKTLKAGLILGLLNAVAYVSQTIGLQTVTSAQAAFITGASVVMVPFILPFFSLGFATKKDIVCALICFFGLFVLVQGDFSHLHAGAAWVLLCAIAVAFSIVYIQKVSKETTSLSLLAFYQILFAALFLLPFMMIKGTQNLFVPSVVVGIIFCAIFATSLTLFLQMKFQHYTTANRAAMIFCFEPIFAAIFGFLINHEALTWRVWVGGAFILMSVILSEFLPCMKKKLLYYARS